MQADGKIIYVTRKNPKLKEEAVPLIFPIKKTPYFEPIEHNNIDDVISYRSF